MTVVEITVQLHGRRYSPLWGMEAGGIRELERLGLPKQAEARSQGTESPQVATAFSLCYVLTGITYSGNGSGDSLTINCFITPHLRLARESQVLLTGFARHKNLFLLGGVTNF